MKEAVIVSTARTGLAKSWKGALNLSHGATVGGHVVRHAVERAGFAQRQKRAAVAVGRERERRLRRQQQFAIVTAGGHGALGEEEDLLRGQPEEAVLPEKRLGRLAVGVQVGQQGDAHRVRFLRGGMLVRSRRRRHSPKVGRPESCAKAGAARDAGWI